MGAGRLVLSRDDHLILGVAVVPHLDELLKGHADVLAVEDGAGECAGLVYLKMLQGPGGKRCNIPVHPVIRNCLNRALKFRIMISSGFWQSALFEWLHTVGFVLL